MAREIVALCDPCADVERRVEGVTRRVDLGGGMREAEVCEECWKTLTIAQLEHVLDAHGRAVDLSGGPGKLRCPWCPQQLATPRNLRDHVDTRHPNQAEAFAEGLIERSRPQRGHEPGGQGGSYICDEAAEDGGICGAVLGSPQGLGGHKWTVHKVAGVSQGAKANRRKPGAA